MLDADQNVDLAQKLERDLVERFGMVLSREALCVILGYPSLEAFRQAYMRKRVPVPMFAVPGRRGLFCLAKDLADWLAVSRQAAIEAANPQPARSAQKIRSYPPSSPRNGPLVPTRFRRTKNKVAD